MAANTRFSVAVHILTVLAFLKKDQVSSDMIAWSVNTNPVFIRRILMDLRRAGLVKASAGKVGGYHLAQPEKSITLWDIYQATEKQGFLALHTNAQNKACPVSRNIRCLLTETVQGAEKAVSEVFRKTSIEDLARTIKKMDKV